MHSRAGIRRCRDIHNRVKRSSAEFALCSPSCDDCSPAECMSHCTVDDTRQKYTPYPETNMCSPRMSTTTRKIQQQRQQPFQPTGSEKTTAVPGPNLCSTTSTEASVIIMVQGSCGVLRSRPTSLSTCVLPSSQTPPTQPET